MNRLQGRSEVLSKSIEAVGFSFYTEDEVHAISVRSITNPILLDNLNRPAPGGLYDPALGPLEQTGSCVTCGEAALQCPGHFGHIDLILPVYNPMVFRMLVKILTHVCLFCHHFKMSKSRVQSFVSQLELISQGRVVEALNSAVSTTDNIESSLKENLLPDAMGGKRDHHGTRKINWTSAQLIAARDSINKLMKEMPKEKCENCGAVVPTIRSEGVGKIFQVPLTKSKQSENLLKGIRLNIALLVGTAGVTSGKSLGQGGIVELPDSKNEPSKGQMQDFTRDNQFEREAKGQSDQFLEKTTQNFLETDQDLNASIVINSLESAEADICSQLRYLTTSEVKAHIRLLWEKEERICSFIWDTQSQYDGTLLKKSNDSSMFFLNAVLVTPNRFRPPNKIHGSIMEHPANVFYGQLIQANMNLTEFLRGFSIVEAINTGHATLLWLILQNAVNKLLDSSTAIGRKGEQNGVRQLLERKDGLFRMNLMGKRVNFSCRSVISPDPYIAVNEIGIPPYFATRLTYPERVTHWNVDRLREAVINGPTRHPGATHVEDEQGVVVSLSNLPKSQRMALSKTLLSRPGSTTSSSCVGMYDGSLESVKASGKIVYRHLRDGDALLVNRQPTLHKPSIMGHIARVLKGEKTLRLHYANCSTYNADFDGDEMNVHFPQDEIGRAEAYQIVNANQQYVVPTSGDPIRGLIQDHIVSAALLTKKDTFLTKHEYQQLVYSACISSAPATFLKGKVQPKVGVVEHDRSIISLSPAILKPKTLWTGKQVITTVLNHVTFGRTPFTVKKIGKVSGDYWGRSSGEIKLRIQKNELLHGVIDKAQFGKFGLVHAFKELYGADSAGQLLSVFSRLFTSFLQMHGFTCGTVDLFLIPMAEKYRQEKLLASEKLGDIVHTRFLGLNDNDDPGPEKIILEIEKTLQTKGELASARLDRMISSALNGVTSDVNNKLFPNGLLKPFPHNCLSLMTTTGAKGGLVNFTQISSLLGQQELEGKRVPRMISGKTLPCFPPWDTKPRAGGFIADRFLTGLRPQEYYFHCMAGRDGLVDTAVKTSRSGYLQRCLMKNLECLTVHYDYTVRDSDGSIIQFLYGEDGVDVMKTSYLAEFKVLAANHALVSERLEGTLRKMQGNCHKDGAFSSNGICAPHPLSAVVPAEFIPESFESNLNHFMQTLSRKKRRDLHLRKRRDRSEFEDLMKLNLLSSCAQPGEPVGVLAAQSIGEPSTQMTLNTFHFAGRGEMNVTLGIPRLREIFMTASRKIATPVMTCPLQQGKTREDAEKLAARFTRIRLVDLIEKLEVGVVPFYVHGNGMRKLYKVKLLMYAFDKYPPYLELQHYECEQAVRERFIPLLTREMAKAVSFRSGKNVKDAIQVLPLSQAGEDTAEAASDEEESEILNPKKTKKNVEFGEQADEEDDEVEAEDDGADAEKRRGQGTDERGYDDEIDEDEKAFSEKTHDDERIADEEMDEDETGTVHDDDDDDEGGKSLKDTNDELTGHFKVGMVVCKSETKKKKKKRSGGQDSTLFEGSTFEIQFTMKQNTPHVLLSEIVEQVAKQVTIRSVRGIDHCSVIDYKGDTNIPALQANGVNVEGFWAFSDDLDLTKFTTNDIACVLEVYGVEAARATIVSEVQNVFRSYGITVDNRHLNLIADFMTHFGGFRPCNRLGIDYNSSPFLKMSFETAAKFLVETTLGKQSDYLESPSSRIILGQIVDLGTGCFDLLQNINY